MSLLWLVLACGGGAESTPTPASGRPPLDSASPHTGQEPEPPDSDPLPHTGETGETTGSTLPIDCSLLPSASPLVQLVQPALEESAVASTTLWAEGEAHTLPEHAGEPVQVPILGLKAGTAWRAELQLKASSGSYHCSLHGEVPALPEGSAEISSSSADPARLSAERYWLGAVMGKAPSLIALDRHAGGIAWIRPFTEGERATTLRRAPASTDVLWMQLGSTTEVLRETLLGESVSRTSTPGGHHDFVRHDDGQLAWIASATTPYEDPLWGEITLVHDQLLQRPEGSHEEPDLVFDVWRDYPELEVQPNDFWDPASSSQPWSYANALAWDPLRHTYLMCWAYAELLLELDRAGQVQRQLGGPGGYAVGPPGLGVPHDPTWTESGSLLVSTTSEGATRAAEFDVDDAARSLTATWECGVEAGIDSYALGMARRLSNGNSFVQWGNAGVMVEYSPSCEELWRAEIGGGSWFANGVLVEDLYLAE